MWRKILIVIAVICLLAGIGFLLFPPVSNYVGQKRADAVTEKFDKAVENTVESITTEDGEEITTAEEAKEAGMVDEEGRVVDQYGEPVVFRLDLDRLYRDSIDYNHRLLTTQGSERTTDYERAVFDLKDYGIDEGIYCYVTINEIGMRLPVYLGSDKMTLSSGAGHLYGTSLPVGDEDMTCAFAGHTGYTGTIFFDKIRRLEAGAEVKITTWWGDSYYTVTDHKIIKPNESSDLEIRPGQQKLTLITCIYNEEMQFDRYLVICEKK